MEQWQEDDDVLMKMIAKLLNKKKADCKFKIIDDSDKIDEHCKVNNSSTNRNDATEAYINDIAHYKGNTLAPTLFSSINSTFQADSCIKNVRLFVLERRVRLISLPLHIYFNSSYYFVPLNAGDELTTCMNMKQAQ